MTGNDARHRTAAELAGHDGFSLISNQKLHQLYSALVECRLLDERVRRLFAENHFGGDSARGMGLEAAVAAAAIDLRPDDSIAPSRCAFLLRFVQGKPLGEILAHEAQHVRLPNSGDALRLALGTALSHKTGKNGGIVLVFGDKEDALPEPWKEALHVAGVHRLPILFVRRSRPILEPVHARKPVRAVETGKSAGSYTLPTIPVDGNDVVAVYRVATEAIAHARKGSGPTLIECGSARAVAPCDTTGEASDDAILNMEAYLTRKGLFRAEWKSESVARFARELDAACEAQAKQRSVASKAEGGSAPSWR